MSQYHSFVHFFLLLKRFPNCSTSRLYFVSADGALRMIDSRYWLIDCEKIARSGPLDLY